LKKGSVSAVLIVKNAQRVLERSLESVAWADEIIVVDGGSEDRTLEIARKFTPKVHHRLFDDYSTQKNFAISLATGEWIFSIDADEVASPGLQASLAKTAKERSSLNGYWVRRDNYLFGKRLCFAGQSGEKILRFFKKGKAQFCQPIHEAVRVEGEVGELKGTLQHYSSRYVKDYLDKLALYTDLEARWLKEDGPRVSVFTLCLKPLAFFIYNYFLRLGFLDGYEGFLYHSLSFFNQVLKVARLEEVRTYREKPSGTPSFSASR